MYPPLMPKYLSGKLPTGHSRQLLLQHRYTFDQGLVHEVTMTSIDSAVYKTQHGEVEQR